MSQQTFKRSLKEERREISRRFKRGDVTRITVVQDAAGKVVLVSTNYERAQSALNRLGRGDEALQMQDFEVEP